jgi:hypothetical protein
MLAATRAASSDSRRGLLPAPTVAASYNSEYELRGTLFLEVLRAVLECGLDPLET